MECQASIFIRTHCSYSSLFQAFSDTVQGDQGCFGIVAGLFGQYPGAKAEERESEVRTHGRVRCFGSYPSD